MTSIMSAGCGVCGIMPGGSKKRTQKKKSNKKRKGCNCDNSLKKILFFTLRNKKRSTSQKGGFIPSKKHISRRSTSKKTNNSFLISKTKKKINQLGGVFGEVFPFSTNSHSFANIGSLENPTNTRLLGGNANTAPSNTESISTIVSKQFSGPNDGSEIIPAPLV